MNNTMTTQTGQLTHDMLADDVALIYRWMTTPGGGGVRLDRTPDGWIDDRTGQTYPTIEAAYEALQDTI